MGAPGMVENGPDHASGPSRYAARPLSDAPPLPSNSGDPSNTINGSPDTMNVSTGNMNDPPDNTDGPSGDGYNNRRTVWMIRI